MSNNWQSQHNQNGSVPENAPRKSGLLSNYARQQSTSEPLSSDNNFNSMGPAPFSPLPPEPGQFNGPGPSQQLPPPYPSMGPSQQAFPSSANQPPQQWNGPTFIARPMQMVQRLSNKMAALRKPVADAPPPMVRYNPTAMPMPPTRGGAAVAEKPRVRQAEPWRRSRTLRINHLRKRRAERNRRNGPGSYRLRTIILTTLAIILVTIVGSTLGYALNFYQSELPQVQNLANMRIDQSTHIYDRSGNLLYTLYKNGKWGAGGRSTPISYSDLPGFLQDAQIATEDPTFWNNNGIDPQGMARALQQYVSAGGKVQSGGSTMTQQLIKNLSGNDETSFQRKASEAALAIGLTQQYPKWKIMEMYFNVTPYGTQDKGIEAAVEDYFNLVPYCNEKHECTPGVQFLNKDLTKCKDPQNETTCADDPTGLLGLTRAAMLVGIPQNPTHLDPTVSNVNYNTLLNSRLPYVLDQMIADSMQINLALGDKKNYVGPITPDIKAKVEALAKKMEIHSFTHTKLAPHFVDWVIQTLADSLGGGTSDDAYAAGLDILSKGGFNIYTTIDLNLENFVEKDVKHNLRDSVYQPYTGYGPLNTVWNVNDSAVVVEDSKNGEVLAMNGSADYADTSDEVAGQVNAALAYRQPGSSIKPIVYAAALEKGWYPGLRIVDNKTYFPTSYTPSMAIAQTSTYVPSDYQKSYHPDLTDANMRIDLDNSFNIPAIKALMFAGIDDVVDMARRLGITAIDDDLAADNKTNGTPNNNYLQDFGPSLALGTPGIPLIQMVGAYQTFANNGVRVPYHNILDIWDNYGHNLYHYDPTHPNGTQVISPQIAFLIGNMLSDNPARAHEFQGIYTLTMNDFPGNAYGTNPQYQVAAKTGTTDNFVDNWTIGYTTSVVVGVWSGNANAKPMTQGVIGISGAGPIWQDVIEYVSGHDNLDMHTDLNYPPGPFSQPDGVKQVTTNSINGLAAGPGVPTWGRGADWVISGMEPEQTGIPPCPAPTTPTPGQNPGPGGVDANGCPINTTPAPGGTPGTGNPGGPGPNPTGNGYDGGGGPDDNGGFYYPGSY